MTRQSRNVNREASLELSLASVKSLVSDYSLRARQAEEAFHALARSIESGKMLEFQAVLIKHINVRAHERTVQQQAVIQMTLLAVSAALSAEGEEREAMLKQIIQDLTRAVTLQTELAKQSSASK